MPVERIPIVDREQWLALRRHDVTASTVGCLFPEVQHPYQTIAGLHAEKLGLEMPGPDPESAIIRRGTALEPVVAGEVGRLLPGWSISKCQHYLRDTERRIGATPDFDIIDNHGHRGVLQTKTVGSYAFKRQWGEADNPTPPFWITLQVVAEMMLASADFGLIGVLVIGDFAFDTHIIEVDRNSAAEGKIYRAVERFWAAMDAGECPELDYERDTDLVKLLYPQEVEGKTVDLRSDNHILELLDEREAAIDAASAAEKAKERINNEIRAKMGDAESAIVNGWKVTLKTTHQKEQVRKATSYRVLRATRQVEAGR
jgi:predicted phage-related endonuclease